MKDWNCMIFKIQTLSFLFNHCAYKSYHSCQSANYCFCVIFATIWVAFFILHNTWPFKQSSVFRNWSKVAPGQKFWLETGHRSKLASAQTKLGSKMAQIRNGPCQKWPRLINGLGQTWSQVEILGRNLDFYKK